MLVSIIIPVYKVEEYIERCLISAFEQTYSNIEILIVDDCSPDNSISIAKKLVDKYSKGDIVRIISHSKNKGLSEARNTGIQASKGDFLYFLDSDDCIEPITIDTLVSFTKTEEPDFVIGGVNIINNELSKTVKDYPINYPNGYMLMDYDIVDAFLQYKWYDMACNKLIKKDFMIDNQLFFERGIYHEDTLWSFESSLRAKKIVFSDKRMYNYFLRSNSISISFSEKHMQDLCLIFNRLANKENIYAILKNNIHYYIYLENFRLNLLYKCKNSDFFRYAYTSMIRSKKMDLKNLFNKKIPNKYKRMIIIDLLPLSLIYKIYSKRNPY